MIGSVTSIVVALIVVVVPLTVKLPSTVRLLLIVTSFGSPIVILFAVTVV